MYGCDHCGKKFTAGELTKICVPAGMSLKQCIEEYRDPMCPECEEGTLREVTE